MLQAQRFSLSKCIELECSVLKNSLYALYSSRKTVVVVRFFVLQVQRFSLSKCIELECSVLKSSLYAVASYYVKK